MFNHIKGKKLYRNPKDALIFGVAAGLAHFLQVDSVFVRLALVVLAIIIGWSPMFILYLIALIVMPIDPSQDTVDAVQEPKDVTPKGPADRMDHSQNM
ncbi:MAG: PspC domain-containing protein [Candidatus Pacebacteria bacterium]|nr:PspC domain-containing protein [Candidatus Paceibacterota bacterium]